MSQSQVISSMLCVLVHNICIIPAPSLLSPAFCANISFLETLKVLLSEVFVCRYVYVDVVRNSVCRIEGRWRVLLRSRLPNRDQLFKHRVRRVQSIQGKNGYLPYGPRTRSSARSSRLPPCPRTSSPECRPLHTLL